MHRGTQVHASASIDCCRRRPAACRSTRLRGGQDHRLVQQGLLPFRRRFADCGDQEVRGQDRHQSRAVAICHPGHDPEDGRGAGFRHPARCRLCRHLRRAGLRQMGLRGQAGRPHRYSRADEAGLRAEHRRDCIALQRRHQEEGLLRLSAEAAVDACADLGRPAGAGRLQAKRHPDRLEGLLVVLVRQGAAGLSQGVGLARLWRRPADGRGVDRLFPEFLHLHGRLQRQARGR